MVKRTVTLAALLAASLIGYALLVAPRWLRVTRLRVAPPALPDEWRGLRIAFLSDFHAGGRAVSLDLLERAKDEALRFEPDLIALGGDFFDNGRWAPGTGDLFTGWPVGTPVLAVLGNHDFRGGPDHVDRLEQMLANAGVCLLHNRATQLDLRGRTAWIAGVDDPHTRRALVRRSLEHTPPGEGALLFLAHSPSAIIDLPIGMARLMLAGHTHGGQVRLLPSGRIPFIQQVRRLRGLPPQPPLPLVRGQHWAHGAVVIISDGLGQSTIGARLRTRPELILIELDRAPEHGPACDEVERFVSYTGNEPGWLRRIT